MTTARLVTRITSVDSVLRLPDPTAPGGHSSRVRPDAPRSAAGSVAARVDRKLRLARALMILAGFSASSSAFAQSTIVKWGGSSTGIISSNTAATGTGSTLNTDTVLGGDFVNPNQGVGGGATGYYAGSADPAGINPLFLGARNNTSGGDVVAQLNAAGPSLDSIRTGFTQGQTGQALYFWNQSMVWSAAASNTTGWVDGKDYGFQDGFHLGNVTLDSLSARVGVNTSSGLTTTFRFALLKDGTYYLSEGFNITAATTITRTGASLTSLTWASFDPTTSLLAAASGYATLPDYTGIEGVGLWVEGVRGATATGSTFAVADFTVTAVPEPSTFALLTTIGLVALVVGRRRLARRA